MSTPITPPSGGVYIIVEGWEETPPTPIVPPAGGVYIIAQRPSTIRGMTWSVGISMSQKGWSVS